MVHLYGKTKRVLPTRCLVEKVPMEFRDLFIRLCAPVHISFFPTVTFLPSQKGNVSKKEKLEVT